jgi:hypothetical protein
MRPNRSRFCSPRYQTLNVEALYEARQEAQ